VAFPPAFDRVFDETFPPDTQLANLLGSDLRNLKTDIRERLALQSGILANRPSNMDAAFGGAGYGTIYISTDTNQVFQWNGASWVDITASLSLPKIPTVGGVVVNPISAITPVIWRAPYACTVTHVRGYFDGGTDATINANNAGAALLAASLVMAVADTWTDGGAVQNTAVLAGNAIQLNFVGFTGSPNYVAIQVDFTRP
jgi:hypothetical protein